jgi:hypothetical protein
MLLAVRHAAIHSEFDTMAYEPGLLGIGALATGLPAAIIYLFWKYRAAVNARIIDPNAMIFSPAMAVGSYFIPLVNFVIPYRAMAGIARASGIHQGLVVLWWTAQVGGFVVSVASVFVDDIDTALSPSWIEHVYIVFSVLALIFSWRLVMAVTHSQEEARLNGP